jgi:ubiquinone/menaquinone biosynthesis C-methylase UbiE
VKVEFHHGDAANTPFTDESFDFIVCRAAFKNFTDPVGALVGMHNVLKPGGEALIIDMSRDASDRDIDELVDDMKLGGLDAFAARAIFKHSLRPRAYSKADFQHMAAATPFGAARIEEKSIGLDVWLSK